VAIRILTVTTRHHDRRHTASSVDIPAGPTATTSYQYDTLGRITSAVPSSSTVAINWGQSYVFDPFGNLLQKNVTEGSATAMNLMIDPATNRISTSRGG